MDSKRRSFSLQQYAPLLDTPLASPDSPMKRKAHKNTPLLIKTKVHSYLYRRHNSFLLPIPTWNSRSISTASNQSRKVTYMPNLGFISNSPGSLLKNITMRPRQWSRTSTHLRSTNHSSLSKSSSSRSSSQRSTNIFCIRRAMKSKPRCG